MGLLDGKPYISIMDPVYKPPDQRKSAMDGLLRGLLDVSPLGLLDVAKTAGAAFGNPGLAHTPNPSDYVATLFGLQRPAAQPFSPNENAQRAYDFGTSVAPLAAMAGAHAARWLNPPPMSEIGALRVNKRANAVGAAPDLRSLADQNKNLAWARESDGSFFVRALEAANPETQSKLAWARFSKNGELLEHGKDWVTTPSSSALTRATETAAELAKYWRQGGADPYYFRFGDLPKGGLSKNSITGGYEKGVSVYEAVPDVFGYHTVNRDLNVPFLGQALALERPAYRIAGVPVGTGADGEPVLSGAKILSKIGRDELFNLIFGRE